MRFSNESAANGRIIPALRASISRSLTLARVEPDGSHQSSFHNKDHNAILAYHPVVFEVTDGFEPSYRVLQTLA